MRKYIRKHISLPESIRQELIGTRKRKRLSQSKLGQLMGLPQAHISEIEAGKIVPRFDTILEWVRILEYDFVLVPRVLLPLVEGVIQDYKNPSQEGEAPLYAVEEGNEL